MDVKATLLPGVNGTKALLRGYGDQLVCVHYRYDKKKQKRYKALQSRALSIALCVINTEKGSKCLYVK
jgi:hypothetical protein